MFDQVDFSELELPPSARALQREVREFLRTELAALGFTPHLGHAEFHAGFTRRVAERVELAVREVYDAHDAEDQRQSDPEQSVGAAQHQRIQAVLK